jgi:hypothetical protein
MAAVPFRGRVASSLSDLIETGRTITRRLSSSRPGLLRVESALVGDDRDLKFPEAEGSADPGVESEKDEQQGAEHDERQPGELTRPGQSAEDQDDGEHT